jgi:Tfp pilus assembly protein PilZ
MKKIFFLLLVSTSIHAATLSENLFLNDRAGFDVSDEQITSLENSVGELVDLNSNVVENSFTGTNDKTSAKWKASGYVTSIGVTSTGKLGILGFKGTAMAEIFWRKKKVTNNFMSELSTEAKDEEAVDAVLSDLSESGISIQSYEFFPLDTRVSLNWKLNSSQFVDLKGKVVWIQQVPYSDSYQIGFNFTEAELNSKIRDEIRQHIDSLRLY